MFETNTPPAASSAIAENCIARFADLKPWSRAFLDSFIPEHQKDNYRVIGSGVFEEPSARAPITAAHGFSLGFVKCAPGKGAALHSHKTLEVFIPLNGRMVLLMGPSPDDEIMLEPWDTVSVPVGEMRGFRNPNEHDLVLLAIVQNGPSGGEKVSWHPQVIGQANAFGASLDGQGNLVVEGEARK